MLSKLILLLLPLCAMAQPPLNLAGSLPEDNHEIVVNNRILCKVNGKTISVVDVMKKMDLFLSRYYPQYANSKQARYQFYSTQWKETLNQMIDNELMVADAESREVTVSDGEVRQEVQERFGPNVMASLAKLQLSYEEARKMVHQDMLVQRMNWFRVTSKALQKVNSQDVKNAYKQFCVENPPKEEWTYQMLSIRTPNKEKSALLTKRASELVQTHGKDLNAILEILKQENAQDTTVTLNLSQDLVVEDKALAQSHKSVLSHLLQTQGENAISNPIEQVSRDSSVVCRLFHLKSHTQKELPKFEQVAGEIKEALLQKVAAEEMSTYVSRLRERFGYDPKSLEVPSNFEPFSLR
jgi:hypothetical protein